MKIVEMSHILVAHDGREILPDVDLTVNRGDFIAICGPNGGGKTTLLRVMLRLIKPDKGSVRYFNEKGEPTKRLAIGYLPQKSNIDLRFPITVEDTVKSGLLKPLPSKLSSGELESISEVVEQCGISDYLHSPIGVLSGGQLQRTLLARALVSKPELVVLDEPLSYVDKQFESHLYDIFVEIARNATVVLVSHEMTHISRMATSCLEVNHGIHALPPDTSFFPDTLHNQYIL